MGSPLPGAPPRTVTTMQPPHRLCACIWPLLSRGMQTRRPRHPEYDPVEAWGPGPAPPQHPCQRPARAASVVRRGRASSATEGPLRPRCAADPRARWQGRLPGEGAHRPPETSAGSLRYRHLAASAPDHSPGWHEVGFNSTNTRLPGTFFFFFLKQKRAASQNPHIQACA